MRPAALPLAVVITTGLQVVFYAADVRADAATIAAIMAGCAAYFLGGAAPQTSEPRTLALELGDGAGKALSDGKER